MKANKIVVRFWQGKVPSLKAEEYARYHAEVGLKKLQSITGNLGVQVLRRTEKEVTEFTTICACRAWRRPGHFTRCCCRPSASRKM
jgi:hypothetical protein